MMYMNAYICMYIYSDHIKRARETEPHINTRACTTPMFDYTHKVDTHTHTHIPFEGGNFKTMHKIF